MRILVVDDQSELLGLVARALSEGDHRVRTACDVASARREAASFAPDVMVLDVALPDGSGIDLCRELRANGARVPILLLTAHGSVADRVRGLDAGADDFLPKPFALAELRARVRALARRGPLTRGVVLELDGVTLDLAHREARVKGVEVGVTAREWNILELLAARDGRVVSRGEILDAIWGEVSDAASSSLDVLVARIRRKLGSGTIRTVRGGGYALGREGERS